jgi:ApaG protein
MSDGAESTSEAVTHNVRVSVRARFVPERSNPGDNEWFFAYTIEIANESDRTVQLLSRHWIITDADGKVEEVRGPGVVGQQPILGPGQKFEYTSACPLITSFGVMQGTYQMVTPGGDHFEIAIAPFSLHEPYAVN